MKSKVLSVIDIGSGSIRMQIVQFTEAGERIVLENVIRSVALGRDTFSSGRISRAMIEDVCTVLQGFKKLMREYHAAGRRVVATAALREAANRDYVLDQIRTRTGLRVEVLTAAQEIEYTQKAALSVLPSLQERMNEGLLYVHLGSGTTHISAYNADGMLLSQGMPLGFLRIKQMLSHLEGETLQYTPVLSEYLLSRVEPILQKTEKKKDRLYSSYMISGRICELLYQICRGKHPSKAVGHCSMKKLDEIVASFERMSASEIASRYQLEMDQAELALPAMILVRSFAGMTRAEEVQFVFTGLMDGLLLDQWESLQDPEDQQREENCLSYARNLARRYQVDLRHSQRVENYALGLFDSFGRAFELKKRDRLLLRIAAILHDCGNFLGLDDHARYGQMLVEAGEFPGLTDAEKSRAAYLVRFHETEESGELIEAVLDQVPGLFMEERILLSKLLCILRLANALDYSHHHKLQSADFTVRGGKLVVRMVSADDVTLEQWKCAELEKDINEIFGLSLVTVRKRGK